MKVLRRAGKRIGQRVWLLFWAWVPHACKFRFHVRVPSRRFHSLRCKRCGVAVWFFVDVSEGEHGERSERNHH